MASSSADTAATTAAEPEKEAEAQEPAPEAEAEAEAPAAEDKESTSASTSTSAAPAAPSAEQPSAGGGPALTTGGNTLRRRFHASKSSLGGDEDLGLSKGGEAAGGEGHRGLLVCECVADVVRSLALSVLETTIIMTQPFPFLTYRQAGRRRRRRPPDPRRAAAALGAPAVLRRGAGHRGRPALPPHVRGGGGRGPVGRGGQRGRGRRGYVLRI